MIHYQFEILEFEAEKHVAPQQPGEVIEEYEARIAAAKGKNFFRVTTVDISDGKQNAVASGYFAREGKERRKAIVIALAEIEKRLLKREKDRPVIEIAG